MVWHNFHFKDLKIFLMCNFQKSVFNQTIQPIFLKFYVGILGKR